MATMIPKIIHYCWFGKKPKPRILKKCIKSWLKIHPEYKFIEWNETNTDLSHPFVSKCYENKQWAFVSDYIRLKVLYDHGGVYLDTDLLLIKPLNDLMNHSCFLGAEDIHHINCCVIGAVKKNDFIYKCLSTYDTIILEEMGMIGDFTIPKIVTNVFTQLSGISTFENTISFNDVIIFPQEYFYSLPYKKKGEVKKYKKYITNNSIGVHLWVGSWVKENEFKLLKQGKYSLGIKTIITNFNGDKLTDLSYYRKILYAIKLSIKK